MHLRSTRAERSTRAAHENVEGTKREHGTGVQKAVSDTVGERAQNVEVVHTLQRGRKSVKGSRVPHALSLTGKKQLVHQTKLGTQNIRRSRISGAKGRERPLNLQVLPSER